MKRFVAIALILLLVCCSVAVAAEKKDAKQDKPSVDDNTTAIKVPSVKIQYEGATPIRNTLNAQRSTRWEQRIKVMEIKNKTANKRITTEVKGGWLGTTGILGKLLGGIEVTNETLLDKDGAEIVEEPAIKERRVTEENLNETQIYMKDVKEDAKLTGENIKPVMESVRYPHTFNRIINTTNATVTTNITIVKARYDINTTTMWYWVNATRDGQEVATDSPIWIYPAPTSTAISESMDAEGNITLTLTEDPQLSAETVLANYVNGCPVGTRIVGTKE